MKICFNLQVLMSIKNNFLMAEHEQGLKYFKVSILFCKLAKFHT